MGQTDGIDAVRARYSQLARSDDHLLVAAFVDDAAVGYAWAHDRGTHLRSGWRTARLHDLFVAEAHRRRGVGRVLFATVTEWARGHAVRWLEWQASVDALSFYTRLGLRGDPCPDQEHPYFEIDFAQQR
jgi:GNAT superfamily N-acetyltransferase